MIKTTLLTAACATGLAVSSASAAPPAGAPATPLLLVQSKDWSAVTAGGAKGKICYALSKPQKSDPATLNHGDVFFFVSTRPGEGVRNEPSIQVGYAFKEASKVTVDIDGQKFTLFTRADGAWAETPADESKMIATMKRGRTLKVAGQSTRGNATNYTFSLSGIDGALEAIAKECK